MADNLQSVTHAIGVGHNPSLPVPPVVDTVHITEQIVFTISKVFGITIFQTLQLVQGTSDGLTPDPLNQAVESTVSVGWTVAHDRLTAFPPQGVAVGQTILANLSLVRTLSDQLVFSESVATWIDKYAYIDPSTLNYIAGLTRPSEVQFSWSGNTVNIRKPEFGDTDEYSVFRVDRTNRGGDLQIFQDPMWPKTEILDMEFQHVDATTAVDMLTFCVTSLGQSVTFKDHVGRTWAGYILTPASEIVQKGRFNYAIKLQLQGVLQ